MHILVTKKRAPRGPLPKIPIAFDWLYKAPLGLCQPRFPENISEKPAPLPVLSPGALKQGADLESPLGVKRDEQGMQNRLKRRGALALVIYFLMITAISAPMAFFAGRAQSEDSPDPSGSFLAQNGTGERVDYGPLYDAQTAGRPCGGLTDPGIVRRGVWEIHCHPKNEGNGRGRYAMVAGPLAGGKNGPDYALNAAIARTAGNLKGARNADNNARRTNGPLEDAVVAAVAGDAFNSGAANLNGPQSGEPMSLAMATSGPGGLGGSGPTTRGPGLSGPGSGGSLGFTTGVGGGGPSGTPGGFPNNLIPNYEGLTDAPPPEIETIVTPLPAALPMLLTGLAGLFAASRRRKKA